MSVRRVNLGTCVVLRHDVVTMVLVHRCRIDCSHRHAESLRRASRVWCEYDGRSSYSVRLHQTRKQTSAMTIDTGVRSYSNATASSCAYRRPLSLKQARCKWLMEGKPAPDMERPYSVTQPAITPPTLHPVTLRHEVMTDNEKMHILQNTVMGLCSAASAACIRGMTVGKNSRVTLLSRLVGIWKTDRTNPSPSVLYKGVCERRSQRDITLSKLPKAITTTTTKNSLFQPKHSVPQLCSPKQPPR
ncbi:hypothetical protein B0T12DRAFT_34803 [Alternaria alternata]|nr:hypothetical protein B0T12DRAFT_34803 [Alternaria alternata]